MTAAGQPQASPPKDGAKPSEASISDQAVLEYLKSKGMGKAFLELTQKIKEEQEAKKSPTETPSKITRDQLEAEEEKARTQRTVLTKSTGGGFGYDRDAAAPIAQWGVPDSLVVHKKDAANPSTSKGGRHKWVAGSMGEREAKSYLDAFVALQLWILGLPDDSAGIVGWQPKTNNVIAKAKALIDASAETAKSTSDPSKEDPSAVATDASQATKVPDSSDSMDIDQDTEKEEDKAGEGANAKGDEDVTEDASTKKSNGTEDKTKTKENSSDSNVLSTVISELSKPSTTKNETGVSLSAVYPIPPSAKAELLSVSFALLVHTYCELLEVGMESTAHVLRDAFKPIYEPLPSGYGDQYKDLYSCVTTEDMVKLNTHNSQHMEALANLKTILIQVASIQSKKTELQNAMKAAAAHGVSVEPSTQQARQKKLKEYDQTVALLQQKHKEISQRASHAFDRMYELPFLRRARAVRWQLTLSTTSYGMLCQFLNSSVGGSGNDTSLLAMSTLLQTKCELHVEQRDPLPFTPVVVLEDDSVTPGLIEMGPSGSLQIKKGSKDTQIQALSSSVQWAAPVKGSSKQDPDRPFPKFHLEDEYANEAEAKLGKRSVEFNRSLLINGFRRLEALERKRDFQAMSKGSNIDTPGDKGKTKDLAKVDPSVQARRLLANPLEPSIMFSTLCANSTRRREDVTNNNPSGNTPNFLWEESGIGITCAKLCSPDGRRIAVGCDDSAIRVWNLMEERQNGSGGGSHGGNQLSVGDAGQVLLGHKNGFPVFDLSWNRDGRSLLSAGGDGSIRLWDTSAQGPFGEVVQSSSITGAPGPTTPIVASPASKKPIVTPAAARETLIKATESLEKPPDMTVPGVHPESKSYTSGAALAVYRGHAPNTPIWSVAFSPSGYYFASGGSDATARLWTTDRPVPVRLFTGHTSNCIHSVAFHPNCNYIVSGSEDKTVRLWDIQTGQCVRLLNGCPAGIYKVDVDPSGKYAIGADLLGTVHVWDLATGKKVTELKSPRPSSIGTLSPSYTPDYRRKQGVDMVHSFAFSPCGSALATGGDDRTVRIWDIRKAIANPMPVVAEPVKTFATRRAVVMDLQYTKRNLLLSVGKYISAI